MSEDTVQEIVINVRGRGIHLRGNQYGVMKDKLGLWRVIDVNTGRLVYQELVSNGVRDNPEIKITNFVDHHKLKAEAEARGETYRP